MSISIGRSRRIGRGENTVILSAAKDLLMVQSILKPRPVTHPVYANVPGSKTKRWTGAVLSGIAILFLLLDSMGKLIAAAPAVQGAVQLGYSEVTVRVIGIILLACVVLYIVPRTS